MDTRWKVGTSMTQKVIVLGDEMPCDSCGKPATVMIRRGDYALVVCDEHWQEMRQAYIPMTEAFKRGIEEAMQDD